MNPVEFILGDGWRCYALAMTYLTVVLLYREFGK
jgi:hypothetical protein